MAAISRINTIRRMDAILSVVREQPVTVSQIASATDMDLSVAQLWVRDLEKVGLVRRFGVMKHPLRPGISAVLYSIATPIAGPGSAS